MQNGSHGEKEKSRECKAKIRWWKLKETSFQEAFRQEVTKVLGGKDGLPDERDKTAELVRKTAQTVLGVTFEKRKELQESSGEHDRKERGKGSMGQNKR